MTTVALIGWILAVWLFVDRLSCREDAKWWRARADWWHDEAVANARALDRALDRVCEAATAHPLTSAVPAPPETQ